MYFVGKALEQRSYITTKTLPMTKTVELIDKTQFTAMTLNENFKKFVVYITTLSALLVIQVHLFYQAQLELLLADKALVKLLFKYLDYVDIFLFNLIKHWYK